jgi:hypothetical protein
LGFGEPAEGTVHAIWIGRHWWSNAFELQLDGCAIASIEAKGSRATAQVGNTRLTLARLRFPDYITLRSDVTDELVARFCIFPCRNAVRHVEFADGKTFDGGPIWLWNRQATWSRRDGGAVLWSRSKLFDNVVHLHVARPFAYDEKWPLVALCDVAPRIMRQAWFL